MIRQRNKYVALILVACTLAASVWCLILRQGAMAREPAYLNQATHVEMRHLFALACACLADAPLGELPVPPTPTEQTLSILDGCFLSQEKLKTTFRWPSMENRAILDGWGNPISLHPVDDSNWFLLRSCGPDGVDDGGKADDIEHLEQRCDGGSVG